MAITLKFVPYKNQSTERWTLTDETGNYSATNTGGYGTPNAARNTLALLVYGLNRTSGTDVVVSPITYDPTTVTSFIFQFDDDSDRYVRAHIFAVPIQTGAEVTGDYYWNSADGLNIVRLKTAGGYDEVALVDLIGVTDVVQQQLDDVTLYYSANILVNTIQKKLFIALNNNKECYDPTLEELNAHYRQLSLKIQQAEFNLINQQYNRLMAVLPAIQTWIEKNIYYVGG